jgi:hypothetical protein
MKKYLLLAVCVFFWMAGSAAAVEIAWMQVQHREYAGGQAFNRLGFGLIDDGGDYLPDDRGIKEVHLLNPAGKDLKLSTVKFDSTDEIFGSYDAKNSRWHFAGNWQFDSWFSARILDTLEPGVYWLKITTAGGKLVERTFAFNKQVALPLIDADSFLFIPDSHGNLTWTWKVPFELGPLSLGHKLRARAAMDIFKGQKNTGYFSIILPVHMGYVFIPAPVVKAINQKGGRFELKVYLETRDKNNRTYSRPHRVDGKLPEKK